MRRVSGQLVPAGTVAFMLAGMFVLVLASAAPARVPPRPMLRFHLVMQTTQKLDSLLWTGRQFLYVQNTANTVWAAPPAGQPLQQFATMPQLTEETRCVLSPGTDGFPPGVIFCHSPDHKIYEISPDGSSVTVFATLPAPYPPAGDGALAFDNVGRFGYRLVAATGRSGGPPQPDGGVVYMIGSHGAVRQVATYTGPGGADELVIAPIGFGSVAGDALLTVDGGASGGAVVAVAPGGRTRTIATFSEGPNPIAAIPNPPRTTKRTRAPVPGFYVNDDVSGDTFMTPAASLARYAGDVLVGTENVGTDMLPRFWLLKPRGNGFTETRLRNSLPPGSYSLEQGIFVP